MLQIFWLCFFVHTCRLITYVTLIPALRAAVEYETEK